MVWYNPLSWNKPKETTTPVYQGPVKPGTSETVFRQTGQSVPANQVYQGPVKPGTSETVFRQTGQSVPTSGTSSPKFNSNTESFSGSGFTSSGGSVSYKTTDESTGYNPATRVNEGTETKKSSVNNLPTAQKNPSISMVKETSPYRGTSFGTAVKETGGLLLYDVKKLFTTPQEIKDPFTPFSGFDFQGGTGKPEYYSGADIRSMGSTMGLQNLGVPSGTVQGGAYNFNVGQQANLDYIKGNDISKYSSIYSTQSVRTAPYVKTAGIVIGSIVAPEVTGGYLTFKGFQGIANNDPNAGLNLIAGAGSTGYMQIAKEIKYADKLDLVNYNTLKNPKIGFVSNVKQDKFNPDTFIVKTGVTVKAGKDFSSYSDYLTKVKTFDNEKSLALGQGVTISKYKGNIEVSGNIVGSASSDMTNPILIRNLGGTKVITDLSKSLEGTGARIVSTSGSSIRFAKGTFGTDEYFNINKVKYNLEKPVKGNVGGVLYPTKSESTFGFIGSTNKIDNNFYSGRNVFGKINMPSSKIDTGVVNLGSLSGRTSRSMTNLEVPKSVQSIVLKQVSTSVSNVPTVTKPIPDTFYGTSQNLMRTPTIPSSAYSSLGQYERTSTSYDTRNNFKSLTGLSTSTTTILDTNTITRSSSIPILNLKTPSITKQKSRIITTSFTNQIQSQAERQTTKLIQPQVNIPKFKTPSPLITRPVETPWIPPIIPFNFGSFDNKGLASRAFKGKQSKKYTPSFGAIIFNIRGKAPRGIETGARFRPITKGFSFANKPFKFKFPRL